MELLRRNRPDLRRALLWGVVMRGLMQFWPVLEILAGALAMQTVALTGIALPFLTPFLITLVDGVLLSLAAGLFMLLVRLALHLWGRRSRPL
jgi:hypothetical protein